MATHFTVTTPVAEFTGTVAGVAFADGSATVTSEQGRALAYFRRHGYGVDQVAGTDEPAPTEADQPIEVGELPAKSAPKADWVAAAVTRGIDAAEADKATKEQLIELLTSKEDQQ